MLISIVMPIYNAAPFLENCLNSILAQSYPHWELLAVDDGSTDESLNILKDYEKRAVQIKVIGLQHAGIIHALQTGFEQAKGELICRMDADDKMPADKLQLMQSAWLNYGKGHLITGKVAYFSAEALGEGYQKYAAWINQLVDHQNHFRHLFRECVIPSCAWLLHREDFLSCGGFDRDIYPEDYDLCFRFFEQGLKIIALPEILHYWRDHPERSSRNDPNYLDNRFLDLKLHYFLKFYCKKEDSNNKVVLWGAGKKGKLIAQYLIKHNIPFHWVTNNEKKIGKDIYKVKIVAPEKFISSANHTTSKTKINKYILALAKPEDQQEVRNQLININLKEGEDFFFFA